MSFDVLTIKSNDKSILSTTFLLELKGTESVRLKQLITVEWFGLTDLDPKNFLIQIVNSCDLFLSVTTHFNYFIKYYELVSMLNVRIQ